MGRARGARTDRRRRARRRRRGAILGARRAAAVAADGRQLFRLKQRAQRRHLAVCVRLCACVFASAHADSAWSDKRAKRSVDHNDCQKESSFSNAVVCGLCVFFICVVVDVQSINRHLIVAFHS